MSREDDIRKKINEIMNEADDFTRAAKTPEYKEFIKEEAEAQERLSLYEKLCHKAHQSGLRIDPGKSIRSSLEKDILISGMRITPDQVSSLVITTMAIGLFLFLPLLILWAAGEKYLLIVITLALAYYFYTLPSYQAAVNRIRAGDESVKVLMYMLIYLRLNPDQIGAVKFAAAKCYGPIGQDMKKVIWDVEMGKYTTIEDALQSYGRKWILFDESFVKALEMLKGLRFVSNERQKEALLQKTLDFVLDSTYKKMRDYTSALRNPIMIIHTMAITLPVFGLIIFPLASIFMSGQVNIPYVMIGYVFILPLVTYWFINRVISKRPGAFSHPAVRDKTPKNVYVLKAGGNTYHIPLIPLCIFLFLLISLVGWIHFLNLTMQYISVHTGNEPEIATKLWKEVMQEQYMASNLIPNTFIALTIPIGMMVALTLYFRSRSARKEQIRKDVEKIEGQFQLTLYELGDVLEGNMPVERAVIYLIEDYERSETKQSEILEFMKRIRDNMFVFHMTFRKAFFDKEHGVVYMYPSELIRDVSRVLTDSAQKGPLILAMISKTVSRFLTRMSEVEQSLKEMLDETMSSIILQVTFITPFICGIVASASALLVQMLQQLSLILEKIEGMFNLQTTMIGSGTQSLTDTLGLIKLEEIIPPTFLQVFVGVYMVEVTLLLCLLLTGIQYGFDEVNRDMLIARTIIKAVLIYAIVVLVVTVLFYPVLSNIVSMGT